MLDNLLFHRLFSAASILRWNDHLRPVKLTELDKQAHQLMIAYLIAKNKKQRINWGDLIEVAIFEFLKSISLKDIKKSVLYKINENPKNTEKLHSYVLSDFKSYTENLSNDFYYKFVTYLTKTDSYKNERKILKAAGLIAAHWEFKIISKHNEKINNIKETEKKLRRDMKEYISFHEVHEYYKKISDNKVNLNGKNDFIDITGSLRFQTRWSQTPRIPETSVLGHMFLTAAITYFLMNEIFTEKDDKKPNLCPPSSKRFFNNFFAALFHDLPEAFTRDIISPIKNNVKDLKDVIEKIEEEELDDKLRPILNTDLFKELYYFCRNEFECKIFVKKNPEFKHSSEVINKEYFRDRYSPLDGQLLKIADELSAYMEAIHSIKHGISSQDLLYGKDKLEAKYKTFKYLGFDISKYFKS